MYQCLYKIKTIKESNNYGNECNRANLASSDGLHYYGRHGGNITVSRL